MMIKILDLAFSQYSGMVYDVLDNSKINYTSEANF